jgi:hypothetical protein
MDRISLLERLPFEILTIILKILPIGDLASLCLFQRWITFHVRHVLYAKLHVKPIYDNGLLDRKSWGFILTLVEFPHIAQTCLTRILIEKDPRACDAARLHLHTLLILHLKIIVRRARGLRYFQYHGPSPIDFMSDMNCSSLVRLDVANICGTLPILELPKLEVLSMGISGVDHLNWVSNHLHFDSLRILSLISSSPKCIPLSFSLKSSKLRRLELTGFCLVQWPIFELPFLKEYWLDSCSGVTESLQRLKLHCESSLAVFGAVGCDLDGACVELHDSIQDLALVDLSLIFNGGIIQHEKILPYLPTLKSLTIGNVALHRHSGSPFNQLQLLSRLFPSLEKLALQLPNFRINSDEAHELRNPLTWRLSTLELLGMQPRMVKPRLACYLARPFLGPGKPPLKVKICNSAWSIAKGPTARTWATATALPTW